MSLADHAVELALSAGWDEEPDAVWEPWVPVLGQRVMIRSNDECPTRDARASTIDGALATIDLVLPMGTTGIDPGHRFGFRLDDGRFGIAAACELVPIQPAEDADGALGREVTE